MFYALDAGRPFSEGDSAQYATLARTGDLLEVPSHIGYLLVGWLTVHLLPFLPAEIALRGLSLIFGALGVAATYKIVWHYTQDGLASWLAALVLLVAGEYWFLSTVIEVFTVQSGSLLAAYALWLGPPPPESTGEPPAPPGFMTYLRSAGAVILVVFAASVSPSTVAFLPIFLFGRKITKGWWIAFALACLSLIGVFVFQPQILDMVLKGRELHPTLWGALRDLTFMGVSLGLVTAVTVILVFIDSLAFPNDKTRTKRTRLFLAGIALTLLVHLPVASIVGTGPFIPTYGLVAAAFGVAAAWLRANSHLPRRSMLRLAAIVIVIIAMGIVLLVISRITDTKLSEYSTRWLTLYGENLILPVLVLSALSLLLILLTLFSFYFKRIPSHLVGSFALATVFSAHLFIGLTLVVIPHRQIQRQELESIRILASLNPSAETLIGTYTGLMLYDYERQGEAEWSKIYLYTDEMAPEDFYAALEREGKLYLVGRYSRRDLEALGVVIPPHTIEPLYEQDFLWVITAKE